MSLAKLKKAELQALAESHDLGYDPDWNKDELVSELEDAGVTEPLTDANQSAGHAHVSKAERRARLMRLHDHTA